MAHLNHPEVTKDASSHALAYQLCSELDRGVAIAHNEVKHGELSSALLTLAAMQRLVNLLDIVLPDLTDRRA